MKINPFASLCTWVRTHRIILSIILLAGVVRCLSLGWGIPLFDQSQRMYHPDEPKIIIAAYKFPPHLSYLPHPTLYHYFLGMLLWPIRKILPPGSPADFLHSYYITYIWARNITILFGVATVVLTFIAGKKIFGEYAGRVAALCVALSMIHVISSSIAITYVPLSLFIVLAFLVLFSVTRESGYASYALLGAIMGCCMGTKYTGILFLAPITVYLLMLDRSHGNFWHAMSRVGIVLICAGTVFIITTPTIFSAQTWQQIGIEWHDLGRHVYSLWSFELWAINARHFFSAVGVPLGILYCVGIVYPVRRSKYDIALLILIAAFILYFRNGFTMRTYIPIIPPMALLAGHALSSLKDFPKARKMVIAIFAAIMLYSLWYVGAAQYLRLHDTRTAAARYISETVPAGERIGVATTSEKYPWTYHGWRYPNIDFTRYKQAHFLARPQWLILSSYDFKNIQTALKEGRFTAPYVWDQTQNWFWHKASPPSPAIFRFYDEVLNKGEEYVLVKSFVPASNITIEFGPPEIRIYTKRTGEGRIYRSLRSGEMRR